MQNTCAEPGHGSQVQGKVYMLAWTLEPHIAVNTEHMHSLLYSAHVHLVLPLGQLSYMYMYSCLSLSLIAFLFVCHRLQLSSPGYTTKFPAIGTV